MECEIYAPAAHSDGGEEGREGGQRGGSGGRGLCSSESPCPGLFPSLLVLASSPLPPALDATLPGSLLVPGRLTPPCTHPERPRARNPRTGTAPQPSRFLPARLCPPLILVVPSLSRSLLLSLSLSLPLSLSLSRSLALSLALSLSEMDLVGFDTPETLPAVTPLLCCGAQQSISYLS